MRPGLDSPQTVKQNGELLGLTYVRVLRVSKVTYWKAAARVNRPFGAAVLEA
jgi:hypothetical protein